MQKYVRFIKDLCDCKLGKRKRRIGWNDEVGGKLEMRIPSASNLLLSSQNENKDQASIYLEEIKYLHEKEQDRRYQINNFEFLLEHLDERCAVVTWLCFIARQLELKSYAFQTTVFFLDKLIEVGLFGGRHSFVLGLGCLSVSCKIHQILACTTSTLSELLVGPIKAKASPHSIAEAERVVLGVLDFNLHPPIEEEFIYLLNSFVPEVERLDMSKLSLATELVILSGIRYMSVSPTRGVRISGVEIAFAILKLAGVDLLHIPQDALKLVKDWDAVEQVQTLLSLEFSKFEGGKYHSISNQWKNICQKPNEQQK